MNIWRNVIICFAIAGALSVMTGCLSTSEDPNEINLKDLDKDNTPDVLDDDIDGDGKINIADDDIDGDGTINTNDNDIDGDGITNNFDNDIDSDNKPNTADNDIDGDGTVNIDDNDIDGDGIENVSDDDIDGDSFKNNVDTDLDGDGITNNNDIDIDGDGITNNSDTDIDNDGTPNAGDTTPGGTDNTSTTGTQGNSNTGADVNQGTVNSGTDQNTGTTKDDTYTDGIAISTTDTIDYQISLDGALDGKIDTSEIVQLQDIRDVIDDAGIALNSFSILDLRITGTAPESFLLQNGSKEVIMSVYYIDANGAKVNIIESSPSSSVAPLLTLNDLSQGVNINDKIRASSPGFAKFVTMIKDQSITSLNTGIEIKFINGITVSSSEIYVTCAFKISGIKEL